MQNNIKSQRRKDFRSDCAYLLIGAIIHQAIEDLKDFRLEWRIDAQEFLYENQRLERFWYTWELSDMLDIDFIRRYASNYLPKGSIYRKLYPPIDMRKYKHAYTSKAKQDNGKQEETSEEAYEVTA
jgi:hypothetical protein